jgi:uncharacterized membrane protein
MDQYESSYPRKVDTPVKGVSIWVSGFIFFAAMMLWLGGIFHALEGFTALVKDSFFVVRPEFALEIDVTVWGWTHLLGGIVMIIAGFGVLTGGLIARLVAIFVAIVSAIWNFYSIPYYPAWSVLLIALDLGVIWAVAAHGREFALQAQRNEINQQEGIMNQDQEVIVAGFREEMAARQALHELDEEKKRGAIEVKDAALVTRGDDWKLRISDSADKGFGRGAMIGGVAGAAVGLLAGPIGWATLGGAAVGGLAAKLRDGGFPDERLRKIGEDIQPGAAVLVAVVTPTSAPTVEHVLEEKGGSIAMEEVPGEVASGLDEEAEKAQASNS